MADIMDYLDWRGDLSFKQAAFNEVDNLILSQVAYVNFDGILPGIDCDDAMTLEEACQLFFKINDEKEVLKDKSFTRLAPILMKKMAQSERFKRLGLCKYKSQIDYETQKQFAAMHMILDDGTIYIAFRGTDDTIIGWKEDFNMSFMTPVPAQIEAVNYINQTTAHLKQEIRIGGHSKGGNLAIYAAVKCKEEIKARILKVYNNDGPGFNKQMIMSPDYQEMLTKIEKIVPQYSVVGMLLEHEEDYVVVKSKQIGLLQHDAMSWEVLGGQFVYSDELTRGSQILDDTLKAWINGLSEKERAQFVDSIFDILEATGART
ncbi:MAG: DUF2974 domain-containing protein, partial [Candidatus Cellulosilyticum pullistercoris]|nr:DUF2974 domain-containing protein [Candidatus Cellulosilyticum pullistercoris]